MSRFFNLSELTSDHAPSLAMWVFENKLATSISGTLLHVQIRNAKPIRLPAFCKNVIRNTFHHDLTKSSMSQYYKVCHNMTDADLSVTEYQLNLTSECISDFKVELDKLKNPEKYKESEWI